MARYSRVLTGVAAAALLSSCAAQRTTPPKSPARTPEVAQTPTVVAAQIDRSTSDTSSSSAVQTQTAAEGTAPSQVPAWTGCLISRTDLEAETNEQATIAPPGGQILFLNWTDPRAGQAQRLRLIVGLSSLPTTAKQVSFKGYATLQGQGELGNLESDTVDGKIGATAEAAAFEVTVTARDNLKNRLQADGTDRFTVEVRRVKRTNLCASAPTG